MFPSTKTRSAGQGTGWSLFRVNAGGGTAEPLTTLDTGQKETRHSWPELLPGGTAMLFSVSTNAGGSFDDAHVAVLSLATGKHHTIIEQGYHARYVPTGHIVYILGGNLMAVPFDLNRLETSGRPVAIVEGAPGAATIGTAGFAVSQTGFLTYVRGGTTSAIRRTLVWVNRQGGEEAITAPPRAYSDPRLSPDGMHVALDVRGE